MIWDIIPGYSLCKMLYYKIKYSGNKIGYKARIGSGSFLEGANEILAYSFFKGEIGYGSYISPYCNISGSIGRFCSIAPHVNVISGIHPMREPFATTSPFFYSKRSSRKGFTFSNHNMFAEIKYADPINKYDVVIESDCWIGSNCLLIAGVHIGCGAVILAGSVVTKDIPPYAIVGGVPAKIIAYRYDEETIRWLVESNVWKQPISWFSTNWKLFTDIEKLKKEFENRKQE